jgi:hypothetical protein
MTDAWPDILTHRGKVPAPPCIYEHRLWASIVSRHSMGKLFRPNASAHTCEFNDIMP